MSVCPISVFSDDTKSREIAIVDGLEYQIPVTQLKGVPNCT